MSCKLNRADRPGIAAAVRHWILDDKKLHVTGLTSLELAQGTDSDVETHDHHSDQHSCSNEDICKLA